MGHQAIAGSVALCLLLLGGCTSGGLFNSGFPFQPQPRWDSFSGDQDGGFWLWLAGFAVAAAVVSELPREPEPFVLPPDSPEGPFYLRDYFPIAEGNSWTWKLYTSETRGDEKAVSFTLTIDEIVDAGEYEVWHAVIDAPWYIVYGFSWLFGGEDRGYAVEVDGSVYFTPDDAGVQGRIEALPNLDGWNVVPLYSDLSPREIRTRWDDDPIIVRYYGAYYPDALPDEARADLLNERYHPEDPVVVMDTSERGTVWQQARMMLGPRTGVLFGVTRLGNFYLHEAKLNEREEAATD